MKTTVSADPPSAASSISTCSGTPSSAITVCAGECREPNGAESPSRREIPRRRCTTLIAVPAAATPAAPATVPAMRPVRPIRLALPLAVDHPPGEPAADPRDDLVADRAGGLGPVLRRRLAGRPRSEE